MYTDYFPILKNSRDTIYLDSASSTQKPQAVIDSMNTFMQTSYANIHRGAYDLSMNASLIFDKTKKKIWEFLGGVSTHEIVFTYNATYAINYIAHSLCISNFLKKGDTILLSKIDHHANIVPWQIIAKHYGITIHWVNTKSDGTLDYEDLKQKISSVQLVAISWASNVTGELLNLDTLGSYIEDLPQKPIIIIDWSQRFPHVYTDLKKYNYIDAFIATGHKIMSDTGIGFYYMKKDLLKKLDPIFCGWGAINGVTVDGYEPAWLPFRHEPGTPHIIWAASLLSALEFIESIWWYSAIETYEGELTEYALAQCKTLPDGIKLLWGQSSDHRLWVFSFSFRDHHPHDIAEKLADIGICVRSGHHCAEPLHASIGVWASLRMSLYIYNTKADIDRFFDALISLTA